MSKEFYDIESQQMIMVQSKNTFKSQFTKLKTTVVNHHKSLLILGVMLIGTFIAVYHYNQIEQEPEEFDFSAFALRSDDESMRIRNLMSDQSNNIIKVATFNFGGPNVSPFEYYPSEGTKWYSTFEAINNEIHHTLWNSDKTINDILPSSEDQRVAEIIEKLPRFGTDTLQTLMQEAYDPDNPPLPKELPYESRIFSVLGRLDRYTWLKQDEKYPTGAECRQDLIQSESGTELSYGAWNKKWESKWTELKNDNKPFDSGKFLQNSNLRKRFNGADDSLVLIKKFAVVMLKIFDRICWNAAVKVVQDAKTRGDKTLHLESMFATAFSGSDVQQKKINFLLKVMQDYHVTFVHEGIDFAPSSTEYYVVESESKVTTPSFIIFNKQKFEGFKVGQVRSVKIPAYDTFTAEDLNNEFIAAEYDGVIYAAFHAASSPKKPNRAIDKMDFLQQFGTKVIAGMDCNDEIFKNKEGAYKGTAYPTKSGSMTTLKKRTWIQEQHGKGDNLDSKQKDEIFYHKVDMIGGSGKVMTVDGESEQLRAIRTNPGEKEEEAIPNSKMLSDHFIVSAEFKIND